MPQDLAFEEQGSGPTLGLIHGFTQTKRSWAGMLSALSRDRRVVAIDAPGHGGSAGVHLDLWAAARAITRTCGSADLVGYSMGGRIALHAALASPDTVTRLVLIGATAGILDAQARQDRRAADEALALRLEAAGDQGVPAFLHEWLARPLFARLDQSAADLPARLGNTATGLAASLRLCGTGVQEPLDDRLPEIAAPTLLVVGEHDHKFRAEAARLADGLSQAEIAVLPGAGHACHLEKPAAFVEILQGWLTG